MLQAEFIRDMHNNYIVLKGMEGKVTAYSTKMLLNNEIPGLLKTELRCIDQMDLFYYDITSKKSLAAFCDQKSLSYTELEKILTGILNTALLGSDYLLSENDFIIEPNFIFINRESLEIELCHLPGRDENIKEQLGRLMEYLMNKTDYKDEAAVILIYAMYKESKEPDCTFEKLLQELNKKNKVPKVKKVKVEPDGCNNGSNDSVAGEERTEPGSSSIHYNHNHPEKKSARLGINNQKYMAGSESGKKMGSITSRGNNTVDYISKKLKNPNKKLFFEKFVKDILHFNQSLLFPEKFQLIVHNIIGKRYGGNTQTTECGQEEVSLEEVESEREFQYFGLRTFVLAGIFILSGIFILALAIQFKFIYNTFGTHVDVIKLISLIIVLGSLEVYAIIKLFDPKNKLTGIKTEVEYIAPEEESTRKETDKVFPDMDGVLRTESEEYGDATQLLWTDNMDTQQEATEILAQVLPEKFYRLTAAGKESNEDIYIKEFPYSIGKLRKGINLTIDDNSVSRHHARLTKSREGIYLTDLNSTNGTYLNGVKLTENKPYLLTEKDEISFSHIKYIWSVYSETR